MKISKLVALIVPLAAALLLSLPFSTAAGIDDLDGDGDIDRHDVQRIINALGDSSNGAGDAREQDGDGTITVLDARRLALKCTRPSCATEGIQHLIDTLLKFSTDAIPAHDFNTLVSDPDRLESATLILTFEGVGMGFGETHFVELLDPDAEWSEQTVTWNTRPGVDPTQTALSFVLNFIVPFRIDVPSLVHGALQATGPPVSIGFQLRRSPSEFSTFTNV